MIPSNKLRLLANATLNDFALLTSAMHMAWKRYIGGRLKSDHQYSVGIDYNTSPLPSTDSDLSRLNALAQAVLDARATDSGATLADLYDADLMPPNLRRAHQPLDRAVGGSICAPGSLPKVSAPSICSCCTRRCKLRLNSRRGAKSKRRRRASASRREPR